MTTKRTPKFRHHKGSDQGFVELGGRRHYLGRFERPETRERYHRMIAEWEAAGQQPPVARDEITIDELVARFWTHAWIYYRRPDGTMTNEIESLKLAMRPLCALYGSTPRLGGDGRRTKEARIPPPSSQRRCRGG